VDDDDHDSEDSQKSELLEKAILTKENVGKNFQNGLKNMLNCFTRLFQKESKT